ncbi:ABC transporter ATP-binding protein [Pseudothermotoga sp. U03pept]|uniref:ABC transporter ATP-binding protein n=1 Tax=Pseudothermotoga sp. U03pept TaxID=3447012 RepID=UPI003EFEEA7D
MLEVRNVVVRYGRITAVNGVSFTLNEGELLALIGANGAGKSSTLNAVMGLVKVAEGEILFEGKRITQMNSWERAKLGISMVPETARPFGDMTVMENLEIGGTLSDKITFKNKVKEVFEIFPRLAERRKQLAKTLSGGEKQMLAIARALVGPVKLLLLDEVSLGLMPLLVNEIFKVIDKLKERRLTILLSEQNTKKSLQVADRVCVMQNGVIVAEGSVEQLVNSEQLRKAYLGV